MDIRPIPAFYCCYLLRSKQNPRSLYVGSTPNPVRRLAQHNGLSKGGAVRTARVKDRPWEMTCIVTGFPSNIAALQFEWAWQNSHVTKRIADEQRITITKDKSQKRRKRPHSSLGDKLSNLHLLLRVPSFARWPLGVRFFCDDVYQVWQRRNEMADGNIRDDIEIKLDLKQPANINGTENLPVSTLAERKRMREAVGKGGLEGLDVGYKKFKSHVEKSTFLLAEGEDTRCAICSEKVGPQLSMALVCSRDGCRVASHVTCLASKVLNDEGESCTIPTTGSCPGCKVKFDWIDLVMEMSLRVRGEKEVVRMMRRPKECKRKAPRSVKATSSQIDVDDRVSDSGVDADDVLAEEVLHDTNSSDDILPDDWHQHVDNCEDLESVTSAASACSDFTSPSSGTLVNLKLGAVIEDSEWDDADILD